MPPSLLIFYDQDAHLSNNPGIILTVVIQDLVVKIKVAQMLFTFMPEVHF